MSQLFEIDCRRNEELPRLAWCAEVLPDERRITLDCGRDVECQDDFFVEGAWNGDFSDPGFAEALIFTGSGARVVSDGVIVSTASHPLEPLYSARIERKVLFANSLALLLAKTGLELDERYPHYLSVFSSPRYGIRRYTKQIRTRTGRIDVLLYCSIKIDGSGRLQKLARPERGPFRDFADYRDFLVRGLEALWANSRDGSRQRQYGLISTVSSGYDSPACAALAKAIGGSEALTFRAAADGDDDSGTPIARHLGLEIHEFDREDGFANSQALLEFSSSVEGDLHFAACENVLDGKLCLTGFFGDSLWGKKFKPPWGEPENLSLVRSDFAGGSLNEFRLRVGFIHVPVAMLGMSRDRSLWKITHSEEMKPWTLGTSYDRPIARRIAEEAGVPREAFGQKKRVTATVLDRQSQHAVQARFLAEYRQYAARVYKPNKLLVAAHNLAADLLHYGRRAARLLDQKSLLPARLRSPMHAAPLVPIRYLYRIDEDSYLVPWALGKLRDNYLAALSLQAVTSKDRDE